MHSIIKACIKSKDFDSEKDMKPFKTAKKTSIKYYDFAFDYVGIYYQMNEEKLSI